MPLKWSHNSALDRQQGALIEPASFITALSDAINKLFGRPAVALLGMSVAFFLLPRPWLAAIGIDQSNSTWKAVAGVTLVASVVMCLISAAPYALRPLAAIRARLKANRAFHSVPLPSRMLLITHDVMGETHILAPPGYEALQALIDHGLAFHVVAQNGIISAEIGIRGRDFIKRNRAILRREVEEHEADAKRLMEDRAQFVERFFRRC